MGAVSALAGFGVNPTEGLPQRAPVAPRPCGDDLGEDRERRLGGRVRADVEAARAGDPLERVLGDAGLEQPLAPPLLVSPRTERTDVERLRLQRPLQCGHVELV